MPKLSGLVLWDFIIARPFRRELLSLQDKFVASRNKTMCRETHRMSNIPMGLRCWGVSRVTERERERERPTSAAILVGQQFQ